MIDFTNSADTARHDRLVALVRHMPALQLQMRTAATAPQQSHLQQQITAIDAAIDALVDELYGVCAKAGTYDPVDSLY